MHYLGYFAAILMGLSLGVLGGGGSILSVPILVYLFEVDPLIATSGSLFIVGTTALIGALINVKQKRVDFKTGAIFAAPSFAGVFIARNLVLPFIPDQLFEFHSFVLTKGLLVMGLFGIIMVLASNAMIRSGLGKNATDQSVSTSNLKIIWQGLLVGFTTGIVGAGGGFLIIPALTLLLKLPMRIAVGTSLAIIAANSLFGFSLSLAQTEHNWSLLLTITGIGIGGLFLGQLFAARTNEKVLKIGFGIFVLTVGSFVLLDQILKTLR